METHAHARELRKGTRVRLRRDVDRFPHFIAEAGSLGVVVSEAGDEVVRVRLDMPLPGAADWDNEVHWFDGLNPADDLEDVMSCSDCGREVEVHESGRCDSCETQHAYDRAAEAGRRDRERAIALRGSSLRDLTDAEGRRLEDGGAS